MRWMEFKKSAKTPVLHLNVICCGEDNLIYWRLLTSHQLIKNYNHLLRYYNFIYNFRYFLVMTESKKGLIPCGHSCWRSSTSTGTPCISPAQLILY